MLFTSVWYGQNYVETLWQSLDLDDSLMSVAIMHFYKCGAELKSISEVIKVMTTFSRLVMVVINVIL